MHTIVIKSFAHTLFRILPVLFALLLIAITMASTSATSTYIAIGQSFPSLEAAKAAIKQAISEQHASFIVDYSDKTRFRIVCPQKPQCNFQVRATNSKRNGILITHVIPHTCSPATHF